MILSRPAKSLTALIAICKIASLLALPWSLSLRMSNALRTGAWYLFTLPTLLCALTGTSLMSIAINPVFCLNSADAKFFLASVTILSGGP
jgi:hypothetical protein